MAVYTKINNRDIRSLGNHYDIGKITKFEGIKKGIENTNYLLKTNKKKFVLTIFEKRVQKKDLPFFMNLMEKLNENKIICPKPLKSKKDKHLCEIKKKPSCIVTFLKGTDKTNLNYKNCFDIGKNIAKFHKVTTKMKSYRQNSMSIKKLGTLLKSIKFKSNKISPKLKPTLNACLKKKKKKWPKKLPEGIIHGDLFIDNIFFNKNKFSGFIDFYFSSNDYLMYEIAICINSLCFDKRNNSFGHLFLISFKHALRVGLSFGGILLDLNLILLNKVPNFLIFLLFITKELFLLSKHNEFIQIAISYIRYSLLEK